MQTLYDQEAYAGSNQQLLQALAEQLKTPFTHIARSAEAAQTGSRTDFIDYLQHIELTADSAIRLIDGYLLSMQLQLEQQSLELHPVSVASVLHDAAHELEPLAKRYGTKLELHLAGKYAPVMAHEQAFRSALESLGSVLIESDHEEAKKTITFGAHRTAQGGVAAGVFGGAEGLTVDMYRRARQLYGRARSPLQHVTSAPGAGIFVADSLLGAMSARLRVARHHNTVGMAATFMPSKQLQLV